jgi:hypothetical protein
MRWAPSVVIVLGLLAAPPLAAQFTLPAVVDPATYESRSGEYVLEVDPSHVHGQGPAAYRLTRQGREIWSGPRPFTLLEAAVGDDGVVAGYAYHGGTEDFAKDDALHLVILDPRGRPRLDATTPRRMSRVIDGGSEPNVHGLVFDPDHDRVVFRVANVSESEVWKPYRLSTGQALPTFNPESLMAVGELKVWLSDARPVRGTTLTLVEWGRNDYAKGQEGTRFTLVEAAGKPVWALDLPKDREAAAGDRQAQARLARLSSISGILSVDRPGEFEVRVLATSERVLHRVALGGTRRWRVTELRRQALLEEPTAAAPLEAVPERPLKYLGAVRLGGGAEGGRSVMRGVQEFDLDDQGRFGFARVDAPCEVTLVVGGLEGGTPRELRLGSLEQESSSPLVAWAGGSTWLVSARFAQAERGAGWWVDAASGATRPFELPSGLSVGALAGRPGGGAVVLGEQESSTVLLWLDAAGRQERRFSEAAHSSASRLLSPEDVTVTASGETLVIDNIQHLVTAFDAKGAPQRTIDLAKAWGRKPSYPSGISRDADGGFVCEDFGAAIPLVRMRADGTMKAGVQPRYADGRPTGRLFRVRAAADGALWGSDGEAVLRLGDDGVVERTIGAAADPGDLGEIAAVALDSSDRIHAADRRTGAVHVFSPEGKRQHVCRPDPGDVTEALGPPASASRPTGACTCTWATCWRGASSSSRPRANAWSATHPMTRLGSGTPPAAGCGRSAGRGSRSRTRRGARCAPWAGVPTGRGSATRRGPWPPPTGRSRWPPAAWAAATTGPGR